MPVRPSAHWPTNRKYLICNTGSLNVNHIADNKNFWKVVKQIISNKTLVTNRGMLRDGCKIISDTEKVADTFNKFFIVNIGKTLKIDKDKQFLVETIDVFGPAFLELKDE